MSDTTRCHPRTLLAAFPDDKAEYACALERPRYASLWPEVRACAALVAFIVTILLGGTAVARFIGG